MNNNYKTNLNINNNYNGLCLRERKTHVHNRN